jgi:hypothetical protein
VIDPTTGQRHRLEQLFDTDDHVEVEATWGVYQRMITAYREPDRERGREVMTKLIDSISRDVPAALGELITLGRTLKQRASMSLPMSTGPAPRTAQRRQSTDDSNTSEDRPAGSATSPTTSPDACSKQADSEPSYTVDCDEPDSLSGIRLCPLGR